MGTCNERLSVILISLGLIPAIVASMGGGVLSSKTSTDEFDSECMDILNLLASLEGFDYSKVEIAKRLFGDEKINFEVETWKGKCYYGIGTLNGKVVIVSNKLFKNPTLLAFSDSKTVKMLFRNPSEKLFEEAIKTRKIRIEGVGFAEGIKVGLVNVFGKYYPLSKEEKENETSNITLTFFNLSWEGDKDGDGILDSQDACDPYVLRGNLAEQGILEGDENIKYLTCPSFYSREGEEYYGNSPYLDIYDYVMDNGCCVKDTDGGIRYYTKGSICVENVSYSLPTGREGSSEAPPGQGRIVFGEVRSECKRVYTDYCLDDKTLVEYYYEPPRRVVYNHPLLGHQVVWISGGVKNKTYECPFGCSNGACICEDIDAAGPIWWTREERGKNYEERRTYDRETLEKFGFYSYHPDFQIGYLNDVCINDTHYKEWYATVDVIPVGQSGLSEDRCILKYEMRRCPYGCDVSIQKCHPASCSDGIQNQGEEGIDCGGPCPPCNTKYRTNAIYAPHDTPCTDKWRPPTGSNDKITTCEVVEVCDEKADVYIKEALACCDPALNQTIEFDSISCDFAKRNTPKTLSKKDYIKRCAALYIIKNMGDSAVPNDKKIMNYYMQEELCCDHLSACYNGTDFYDIFKNCLLDDKK